MMEKLRDAQELVWTPPMIARFWDFEALRPGNFFSFNLGPAVLHGLRRYLRGKSCIVDYGAGPGFLLEDFLAAGYRCAAIEFTPEGVRRLAGQFSGNPNFLGAFHADETGALEGKVDVVFLMEVVEHLYDPALGACLAAIRKLLSPGGLAIITTPNDEDRSALFVMNPETGTVFHRWQHVRSWTADTLEQEMSRHGFACVEKGVTDFNVSLCADQRTHSLPARLIRLVGRQLRGLLRQALKPPHLYLVARKNS
jgi:2-polyprenyl-3-methyl-5-hydroxy-6-metoxy-1,4-benzoquinol methylase